MREGAQLAAHDLPGGGERQRRDEDDFPRRLIMRQTRADKGADILRETGTYRDLGLGHEEGLTLRCATTVSTDGLCSRKGR